MDPCSCQGVLVAQENGIFQPYSALYNCFLEVFSLYYKLATIVNVAAVCPDCNSRHRKSLITKSICFKESLIQCVYTYIDLALDITCLAWQSKVQGKTGNTRNTLTSLIIPGLYSVLYSLKFSRLKNFVNFVGQKITTKISPMKFQVHNRSKAWMEGRPRKIYPWNLRRIWQNHEIFNPQKF